MFERRLKMFLLVLILASGALAARAVQVQWLQHDYWKAHASELLKQHEFIETTRGSILDRTGRVLAYDEPCIDACVDYRAITDEPDPDYVQSRAEQNLLARLGETAYHSLKHSKNWESTRDEEIARVKGDIAAMWTALADVSGKTPDEMADIRREIVSRVDMRKRYIWWFTYEHGGIDRDAGGSPAWYQHFLGDKGQQGVDSDNFKVSVAEETQPQIILRAIPPDAQADLAKQLDRYFCLSLLPSKHRVYPFGRSACHLMGRLAEVGQDDLANDPHGEDEMRKYWPSDLIGRGGVEELCEQTLRGSRGMIERVADSDSTITTTDPIPGKDVRLSIDIELESEIEQAFAQKRVHTDKDGQEVRENQHGAAVVIDVNTGQVLAMVSNPGFDPNFLDDDYSILARDDLNQPLVNRATQMALEPGSTAKTIVGSGAITHGFMTPASTIECTGYLVLRGHKYSIGRCWVASQYANRLDSVAHHPVPFSAPHPTGFLTITDGLERSCNVVFETIADKMGMQELTYWFDQFGLGRPTGIGIEESAGMIPEPVDSSEHSPLRMWTWFAGIGQGRVHATPLQMANVAATIARRGIWLRPNLVSPEDAVRTTTRPQAGLGADRVDLNLAPEAVTAVQEGMFRVVNADAGTGRGILPQSQDNPMAKDPLDQIHIAGKTGTAQTGLMTIPVRDADGQVVRVEGRVQRIPVELGTPTTEGWYKGIGPEKHMAHAWYIGYAPAEKPQIAFCVLVEYGEAGGIVAGAIAHDTLEACVRHGYLSVSP